MDEREALRRHIAAVWAIWVPSLSTADVTLAQNQALPPWTLYQGQIGHEQINVWRAPVTPTERARVLALALQAVRSPTNDVAMRREVILLPAPIDGEQPDRLGFVARLLTSQDAPLIAAFAPGNATALLRPQCAPCVGVIVAGELVSVAYSARRTDVACELGIATLPTARRQGYALAATRLWTALVQQAGLLPIYSAMAANTASRRLAAAAGYRLLAQSVYGPMPPEQDE